MEEPSEKPSGDNSVEPPTKPEELNNNTSNKGGKLLDFPLENFSEGKLL